ncbi:MULTISPECIES: TrkA family potassium uptake protein [unclassified Haladaptatus]|uniref:potassium channel family protein n=1 Tax=unclassified Haladaptatus TaxID=2622732 RepID=UPI0023E75E50|nr:MULTISPECIES: NAD-binding protein [unclassified Haladaptatus]
MASPGSSLQRLVGRESRRNLFITYLLTFVGVVVAFTFAYNTGMRLLENDPQSLSDSLVVVVETFTTTGYGEDAPWATLPMKFLVVTMQFTGIFFVFLALPLFVVPWIETRLSMSAPNAVEDLTDHVIICGYTPRGETLIDELDDREIPSVVIASNREQANALYENGVPVIFGDPETNETLESANIADARAVVADEDDETNASIALTAKDICDTQVITFVETDDAARYHRYAGADFVFSPRHLVGESLANKVTTTLSHELMDSVEIGENFEIVEFSIQDGSPLDGVTIEDSRITEETGANIIGAWLSGEFVSPPGPETVIDEHTMLLVAGDEGQLEQVKSLTLSATRRHSPGPVVIIGYGEVGAEVARALDESGHPFTVVDIEDKPGVDVVGDATDDETLREARLDEASAVILALPDDTVSVFCLLILREHYPDIEILARAEETDSVRKMYRAGADYVLALATVSGRMLASTILDEEVITFDKQIEVVRIAAPNLAGQTLAGADVRQRTGCTVIAVRRNGSVITDVGPDFVIQRDDELIVTGLDEDINQFSKVAG